MKSIGLCMSVFDWMCFSQTSNSTFDRINVRDMQLQTSRWFFRMLDRVVANTSGHFKHDRKLSIICRNRPASSVLNLRMNLVKHGRSCQKRRQFQEQIQNVSKCWFYSYNLHHLEHCSWYKGLSLNKSANEWLDLGTCCQMCWCFVRLKDQRQSAEVSCRNAFEQKIFKFCFWNIIGRIKN